MCRYRSAEAIRQRRCTNKAGLDTRRIATDSRAWWFMIRLCLVSFVNNEYAKDADLAIF